MMKEFDIKELKPEDLHGVYEEIASRCGVECALGIFNEFKGYTITFPNRKYSLSFKYHKMWELKTSGNYSVKEIAKMFDCSERWVRSVLKKVSVEKEIENNK